MRDFRKARARTRIPADVREYPFGHGCYAFAAYKSGDKECVRVVRIDNPKLTMDVWAICFPTHWDYQVISSTMPVEFVQEFDSVLRCNLGYFVRVGIYGRW